MATVTTSCVGQIGETAGAVWHTLDQSGGMSLTKLIKSVEAPRDVVLQAIGWLAREEKLEIEETSRGRIISLR